jgi:hypothetical protein
MKVFSHLLVFPIVVLVLHFTCIPTPAFAINLFSIGAYNTGVDDLGTPIAQGNIDPHYTLNGGADVFATNIVDGAWLPNSATSRWVSTNPNGDDVTVPSGFYDYEVLLDLTGIDTNSFELSLLYTGDNQEGISQNGVSVAGSLTPANESGSQFFPITLTNQTGGGWSAGSNSIVFVVENYVGGPGANPSGLRVEFTEAVPEPSAFLLAALGVLGLLGCVGRRRR